MNGFDREKWRAELAAKARDNFMGREDHGLVPQSDALALLERAYAEGLVEGESTTLLEFENHLPTEHHRGLTAGCFTVVRAALAAARKGTP